ncbi:MAG: glycoside hydrolase family 3 N-terminal domain-containing protein [Chlorobiota bacterium]
MSASARWLAARSIVARLEVPRYCRDGAYRQQVLGWVERGLGGVCLFGGGIDEVARAVAELLATATVPLIVAADLEYGLPMRFRGGTAFPRAYALGRTGNPAWTLRVASAIARQARSLGIGWNFAPVCDIASNPANPVIGIRAFGQSPQEVIPHIRVWIEASQAAGVWACAKHFPGHGDVTVDSHLALPTVTADAQTLHNRELLPFRAAVEAGVVGVMLGHLLVPALGIEPLPASLSAEAVSLLRDEWGYDGLILTDALDMGAITQHWTTAEAVELALRAGVDLLLMPADVEEALAAAARLMEAEPALVEQRRRSLLRLQRLRELSPPPEEVAEHYEALEELELAVQSARAAVEYHADGLLPLPQQGRVAIFAFLGTPQPELATLFFRLLSQHARCTCDIAYVDARSTSEEEQRLLDSAGEATQVVVLFLAPPRLDPAMVQRWYDFTQRCSVRWPTVVVLAGNPFVPVPSTATAVVRTYSDTEPSVAVAAFLLSGVWTTQAGE